MAWFRGPRAKPRGQEENEGNQPFRLRRKDRQADGRERESSLSPGKKLLEPRSKKIVLAVQEARRPQEADATDEWRVVQTSDTRDNEAKESKQSDWCCQCGDRCKQDERKSGPSEVSRSHPRDTKSSSSRVRCPLELHHRLHFRLTFSQDFSQTHDLNSSMLRAAKSLPNLRQQSSQSTRAFASQALFNDRATATYRNFT